MKKMKYRSMGGLTVKDGRLVNDRERIKKAMDKAKKVDMIAAGVTIAELREKLL
jgi:hypothetical protein